MTFRDWIPADGKQGAEGNGFTDFVPAKEVKKEEKLPKDSKVVEKLTDEDIADLGIDKAKLEALEKDK